MEKVLNENYDYTGKEFDCLIDYSNGLVLVDLQNAFSNLKTNIKFPYFKLRNDNNNDVLKVLVIINASFDGVS